MRILALIAALLLAVAPAAWAAPAGWAPLLAPRAVAGLQGAVPGLRILQLPGGGARGYLPGAVAANPELLRGPGENPGAVPPLEAMTAALRGWGIAAETPVVVVPAGRDATDFGMAARVYWTLKSLGVRDLSILNGGLEAWAAEGLPLDPAPAVVAPSAFEPVLDPQWQATTEDVRGIVAAPGGVRLVDARPEGFFAGTDRHPAQSRPGTIEGAESVAFVTWFDGPEMVPAAEVRARAAALGLDDPGVPVVAFCNTGIWAASTWFALSEVAGIDGVRLYPASIVEWSQAEGRMDNVPTRVAYYWWMFRSWLVGLAA